MFRLRLAGAVLPACLLLGCGPAGKDHSVASAPRPPDSTKAYLDEAKAKVRENLKDPESARFEELRVVHLTSGGKNSSLDVVCGSENAKNSMGGYIGFHPFAYVAHVDDRAPTANNNMDHFVSGSLMLEDAGDEEPQDVWNREDAEHLCAQGISFATDDELLATEAGKAEEQILANANQQ